MTGTLPIRRQPMRSAGVAAAMLVVAAGFNDPPGTYGTRTFTYAPRQLFDGVP